MSCKLIITVIFLQFSLFSHYSVSQSLKVDGPGIMDEYIGTINNESYYVSKATGDYFNSRVFTIKNNELSKNKIFPGTFPGNNRTTQQQKKGLAKQHFKWFIIDNNVYSVHKWTNVSLAYVTIFKYDSNLNQIDSIPFFKDNNPNNSNFEPVVRVMNNRVAFVSPLDRALATYVYSSVNLDTKEEYTEYFTLNQKEKLRCSDFTFNSNNDFFLFLEGAENFRVGNTFSKLKPSLMVCVLVGSVDGEVTSKKIYSTNQNEFFKSFKFLNLSDQKVLMCGLVFEEAKENYLKAYRTSHLTFNNIEESEVQIYSIQKIQNTELLYKKELEEIDSKPIYFSAYQHLKEIVPLKNGTYLFISEGHTPINSTETTVGTGSFGTATASIPYPELDYFEAHRNFYYCNNENIFVSNYIDNLGISWTTRTIHRYEYVTMKFGSTQKNKTYFSDLNEQSGILTIYFPQFPGLLKNPPNYNTNNSHTTVAKFTVDLEKGNATLEELETLVTSDGSEAIVVSSTHVRNENELVICTQNKNAVGRCFYRFHVVKR